MLRFCVGVLWVLYADGCIVQVVAVGICMCVLMDVSGKGSQQLLSCCCAAME